MTSTLHLSAGRVDLDRRILVQPDGATLRLTHQEAELLAYLSARPGENVSRDELMDAVWRCRVTPSAVDVAVRRLRRIIERDPSSPDHLHSTHGVGFVFRPLSEPAPRAVHEVPSFGRARLAADLTECGWLVAAVADALGLGERARGLDAVTGALTAGGRSLLVLDDLDSLAEALAPTLARWVAAAPALRILVTSRGLGVVVYSGYIHGSSRVTRQQRGERPSNGRSQRDHRKRARRHPRHHRGVLDCSAELRRTGISTLACECLNHLAGIAFNLDAFERYSRSCETAGGADAELHRALAEGAGEALTVVEALLIRVAGHEGIPL